MPKPYLRPSAGAGKIKNVYGNLVLYVMNIFVQD